MNIHPSTPRCARREYSLVAGSESEGETREKKLAKYIAEIPELEVDEVEEDIDMPELEEIVDDEPQGRIIDFAIAGVDDLQIPPINAMLNIVNRMIDILDAQI